MDDPSEQRELKRRYHSRIPNAVGFLGGAVRDRCEMLVVPGRLAIAQYHVRAQGNTAVTVPLGFATVDPVRIERVLAEFAARLDQARRVMQLWTRGDSGELAELVDFAALGLDRFALKPAGSPVETAVTWKRSRV